MEAMEWAYFVTSLLSLQLRTRRRLPSHHIGREFEGGRQHVAMIYTVLRLTRRAHCFTLNPKI
jgi:hypothetical protein